MIKINISRIAYVLIILGLFLPFVSLSGLIKAKLTGFQYIKGISLSDFGFSNGTDAMIGPYSILIILVTALTLIGLIYSFVSKKKLKNVFVICCSFGLMSLVVFFVPTWIQMKSLRTVEAPGIGLIIDVILFLVIIILNVFRADEKEEVEKIGFKTFLLPLMVLITVVATVLATMTNDIVTSYVGGFRPFIATSAYILIWCSVLWIGYRNRNLFIIGYSVITWLSFLVMLVLSTILNLEISGLSRVLNKMSLILGGIISPKTNSIASLILAATVPNIVITGFTALSLILFLKLKKKKDKATKQSFMAFIETKEALVVFITFIVVFGIFVFWTLTVDLPQMIG